MTLIATKACFSAVSDVPPRLQRVDATGRLTANRIAGRSRIATLYQEGAAKIRMPRTSGDPLEAVLINTAGGLTGGDRLRWEIAAGSDTSISITTQACEKLYKAGIGEARIDCRLDVAAGASLAWLPQETIVYDGSGLSRRVEADLAPGARALILEATLFGRAASGESVRRAQFRDRWRIRVDGRLVHAEDLALEGDVHAILGCNATGRGATAIATLLLVDPDAERHLDAARGILGNEGGASFWSVGGTGKLLARVAARDGLALRARLVPLIELLNGQAGLPKIWTS
jgi:urease accessory protein